MIEGESRMATFGRSSPCETSVLTLAQTAVNNGALACVNYYVNDERDDARSAHREIQVGNPNLPAASIIFCRSFYGFRARILAAR